MSWGIKKKWMYNRFIWFILFIGLSGCKSTEYPIDFEQLSKEERIVIRFSHVVGENTPKGLAARKFAQLVKERSNGFVEVQVFPNGFLYKDGEEMEALLNGNVQMIAPATSKVTALIPEWSVIDLPFAFNSIDEVHEYLTSSTGKELISKFDHEGLLSLGVWDNGFKQLSSREIPIYHPDDLKQLKMRIMPSEIISKQFSISGAIPKEIDFNIVFHHLENGDIDGQENTLSNIDSKSLYTLQDYLTISNHGYLGYLLLMNKEFWDGLPEHVQQIITESLEEVTEWERRIAYKVNAEKLKEIESCKCINVYPLNEEERTTWEEYYLPVYDYYIERFGTTYIHALPKFK